MSENRMTHDIIENSAPSSAQHDLGETRMQRLPVSEK
jgi:hypothetical protein